MQEKPETLEPTEYNAVIEFGYPIDIRDDVGNVCLIYGLLYNTENRDDMFIWEVSRYIAYLQAMVRLQANGTIISPDTLTLSNGNITYISNTTKNFFYRFMKPYLMRFKIHEFKNVIELYPNEHEADFLVMPAPFRRLGVVEETEIDGITLDGFTIKEIQIEDIEDENKEID